MNVSPNNHRLLILGIGNILLRDEGVGVHAVNALAGNPGVPPDVDLLDGGTSGLDLVDHLADRGKVLVIDAIEAGLPPGSITRLSAAHFIDVGGPVISAHETGFLAALTMARQLGCAPAEVIVLGVQVADMTPGLELSASVEARLPLLLSIILKECGGASSACRPVATALAEAPAYRDSAAHACTCQSL